MQCRVTLEIVAGVVVLADDGLVVTADSDGVAVERPDANQGSPPPGHVIQQTFGPPSYEILSAARAPKLARSASPAAASCSTATISASEASTRSNCSPLNRVNCSGMGEPPSGGVPHASERNVRP